MLVLSRKKKESIVVGSGAFGRVLRVTVLEIGSEQVRLGFEADAGVAVHRWEVWEQLRASGEEDPSTAGPAAPVA